LLLGDVIALVGTLGYSIYTVLAKRVAGILRHNFDEHFQRHYRSDYVFAARATQGIRLDWARVGVVGWAGLLYMVVCSAVGGYLLFLLAIAPYGRVARGGGELSATSCGRAALDPAGWPSALRGGFSPAALWCF